MHLLCNPVIPILMNPPLPNLHGKARRMHAQPSVHRMPGPMDDRTPGSTCSIRPHTEGGGAGLRCAPHTHAHAKRIPGGRTTAAGGHAQERPAHVHSTLACPTCIARRTLRSPPPMAPRAFASLYCGVATPLPHTSQGRVQKGKKLLVIPIASFTIERTIDERTGCRLSGRRNN